MPRRTVRPKEAKKPKLKKSSPEARRLIRAALRKHKSTRQATRVLKLSNHMQLVRMLKGEIRDTPQMKAAIVRADARGKRAWSLTRLDEAECIDPAQIKPIIGELERLLKQLQALTPNGHNEQAQPAKDTRNKIRAVEVD